MLFGPQASTKKCSIVVVPRDRFSTTAGCVQSILDNTAADYELILVLGGAPTKTRADLERRFGSRAKFIFKDHFLNPPQARNLGLKASTCDLAVLMDNDIFVRPGWLDALLSCQMDTGAAMVTPIILETEKRIHTAGNDLYITRKNGTAFGHKHLRYHGIELEESCNLKKTPVDYGELHCQLVDVKTALDLGIYDENIMEVGECDSGLTLQKAGKCMYFEPKSVVVFRYPAEGRGVQPEDVRFFEWRWNMKTIMDGYRYFEKKWNLDITEHGRFRNFLWIYHQKVSLLYRLLPYKSTLVIDLLIRKIHKSWGYVAAVPGALIRGIMRRRIGYEAWRKL